MVRDKVKKFAQLAVTNTPNQNQDGQFYPVPAYKVLFAYVRSCLCRGKSR